MNAFNLLALLLLCCAVREKSDEEDEISKEIDKYIKTKKLKDDIRAKVEEKLAIEESVEDISDMIEGERNKIKEKARNLKESYKKKTSKIFDKLNATVSEIKRNPFFRYIRMPHEEESDSDEDSEKENPIVSPAKIKKKHHWMDA